MDYVSFIRLNEMHEEIVKSIDNLKKVIKQQNELVEIVNSSEKAESFKEFLEHINDATSKYEKQVESLESKKALIEEVLEEFKDDEDKKHFADKLFSILGIN